ncbi:hypothetical protein A2U01_0075938, partial [Trifolium medium]|nr:hypothetical protein [Trifolium medium]
SPLASPRSARNWRRKTANFQVPGEHWRAMATLSLSDDIPHSATQAQILKLSLENGLGHAQISFSSLILHENSQFQAQAT